MSENENSEPENNNREEDIGKDDLDEALIAAVKKHPGIWNHMSLDYKNRDKKSQAWMQIEKDIKKSQIWCKSRWNALRNQYSRKKKSLVGKTGQRRRNIEQTGHFQLMLFLGDLPTTANTSSNLVTDTDEDAEAEERNTSHDKIADQASTPSSTYSSSGYRKKKQEESQVDKELVDFLKRPKQQEDEHHHFGMSIATQLRSMSPAMSMWVKMQIQQAVYNCLYPPPPAQYYQPTRVEDANQPNNTNLDQ